MLLFIDLINTGRNDKNKCSVIRERRGVINDAVTKIERRCLDDLDI